MRDYPSKTFRDVHEFCIASGYYVPTGRIYGEYTGLLEYGPVGVELKRRIKALWWKDMVHARDEVFGFDGAIATPESVLKATDNVGTYDELVVKCPRCGSVFRADQIASNTCSRCGQVLQKAGKNRVQVKAKFGAEATSEECYYFRNSTAQNVYASYGYLTDILSIDPPFGIAQIGKAFRNELIPSPFPDRLREFEQMELQYFVNSSKGHEVHKSLTSERIKWWGKIGVSAEYLDVREVSDKELAHYSIATNDIYYSRFGLMMEIEGIAYRGDFDLRSHRRKLESTDINKNLLGMTSHLAREFPVAIEPSMGVDRAVLAVLLESFRQSESGCWMEFPKCICPFLTGVIYDPELPASEEDRTVLKMTLRKAIDTKIPIFVDRDWKQRVKQFRAWGVKKILIRGSFSGTFPLEDGFVVISESKNGYDLVPYADMTKYLSDFIGKQ